MPFLSVSHLGSEAPNWPSEIRGVGVELEGMMTEEDFARLRRDDGTIEGSDAPGVLKLAPPAPHTTTVVRYPVSLRRGKGGVRGQ